MLMIVNMMFLKIYICAHKFMQRTHMTSQKYLNMPKTMVHIGQDLFL